MRVLLSHNFGFLLAALWPVVHLFLYLAVLRRIRAFTREKGIFLWHLFSYGISASAQAILWACGAGSGETFVLAQSLHGIYSLSFLEVWALAEGGYSLRLLSRFLPGQDRKDGVDVLLGARKRAGRLESVRKLGLVSREVERLTPAGLAAARLFWFILHLSGGRSINL